MRQDDTGMGGNERGFQETQWTQILATKTSDPARRQQALNGLLQRYWKPIYCYIRRKGCDNEKAKDLTQGFLHEVILGRDIVSLADRTRGRFRTFLLAALDRYIVSEHRAASALKRAPAGGVISLDNAGGGCIPDPVARATPEQAFTYAWASALLDQVLAQVKEGCLAGGQATHWAVFEDRVVRPTLEGGEPPGMEELCARHRLGSEKAAANMVITIKRRFQKELREHLRQFVTADEDIDEEISDIMKILAAGGAAS